MAILTWIGAVSAVTFIVSLLLIPWIIGRLSPDCFLRLNRKKEAQIPFSALRLLLALLRNAVGLVLLIAGIIMLVIPGQGILTIIMGAMLLSFPGKQRLITSLISRPAVQRSMDWIRKKRKKPSFRWPDEDAPTPKNS